MRKIGIRIVAIAAAAMVMLALPASAANPPRGGGGAARGGGGGARPASGAFHGGGGGARAVGGGARISARPAISRSSAQPSFRGNRSVAIHTPSSSVGGVTRLNSSRNATGNANRKATPNANRNANVTSNAVRNALGSHSTIRNTSALRNTHARALITAHAATAGWNYGREGGHGWWQHRHGGYGWVGPLFWPFAYYDMYAYALWGDGYDDALWDYGYNDIYAGLFAPYGYDDLAGYLPQQASTNPSGLASGAPSAGTGPLAQMCGEDSRDIAGLPIDQVQQAIRPSAAQQAALDELANASAKAAQDIKAACPTDIALTAPSRLAAMRQRVEAMIAAVETVQPRLEKFYGLLSDEQKERLTALGEDQRESNTATKTAGAPAQSCGAAQPGVTDWPAAEIDQTVRPTEAQRASLLALQNAAAKAADILKASCLTDNPLTPPARLAAVGKRLDAMLQAVNTVRPALNDFYAALNDEQKARFEAIGPERTSQADQPKATQTHVRRRGIGSIGNVIRHMLQVF